MRFKTTRKVSRIKNTFTRCRHILKTVKNVTDRPPVHTKMAHFMQADFEDGNQTGTVWKLHRVNTRNDENRRSFNAFGTKLIDSYGVSSFLWHQILATCFLPLIFHRFQHITTSCERDLV